MYTRHDSVRAIYFNYDTKSDRETFFFKKIVQSLNKMEVAFLFNQYRICKLIFTSKVTTANRYICKFSPESGI